MTAKRKVNSPDRLIRPLVRTLQGYVPGEQPNTRGLIKLNTNENPAPPSPRVIRAIWAHTSGATLERNPFWEKTLKFYDVFL